jgi:class 3 adenylate cyclase
MIGSNEERRRRIETILAVLPALLLCLFFAYKRERNTKVYTSFELRVSQQMKQTNDLIGKMMPPHVYESLLNERYKADVLMDVTLVFADIVGFTALSSHKSPTEMVHLLSELFSGFDDAAAENGVYKVHTIGDCYVAMGYTGKPGGRDKHAECLNIMRHAYAMLEVIGTLNTDFPEMGLGMRIGVHTGKVIAGIAGAKIVRYDIYGPDVLIANKMESNGCQGRIHVSDVTKAMLELSSPNSFSFEFNKEVEIKSISAIRKGYFVERVDFH